MTDERIHQAIDQFATLARSIFADGLESVIVYGSVLKETFQPGRSDVNVLLIVSEGQEPKLRELGRRGRSLMRRRDITPLVLTGREFATSADVFPMEYLDIVETHKVVHGRDATQSLQISSDHLRHEVEHQLRGSLVTLRQLAIVAGRPRPFRKTLLRRRLEAWYGSISAILRGLLRLAGSSVIPAAPSELAAEVNRVLGLEAGPFIELIVGGGQTSDPVALIDALLVRLAALVAIVDEGLNMTRGGGAS